MSDLARGTMRTTPQLAVKNDTSANACAKRYTDYILTTACRAQPHLSDRGSIRVIFEQHGPPEPALKFCF
jgi:hypothetical protein